MFRKDTFINGFDSVFHVLDFVAQAVQDDTNERSFIVSADADGEVVTEHCEYVWIKLLGGEDENNVQFFK